ncbi:MAG: aminoacyl-tRNA hydrolase [Candidatus Omnitrophica bacterium]|nr:aminoacyl-tRNA hydrolase [Candidatus Omnitrophota bacterium]
MKLIVGLGNPGRTYAGSRHNVGSLIVKQLAKVYKCPLKRDAGAHSFTGKADIEGEAVILALPVTYMNLSGFAVKLLVKKHKIGPGDLLVICDDLDLELGRIKIRPDGSSGGHRGLESVMENLGSKEFARLRVGIGRPGGNAEVTDYVLSSFQAEEKQGLEEAVEKACSCSAAWVKNGISKSMDIYNRKNKT